MPLLFLWFIPSNQLINSHNGGANWIKLGSILPPTAWSLHKHLGCLSFSYLLTSLLCYPFHFCFWPPALSSAHTDSLQQVKAVKYKSACLSKKQCGSEWKVCRDFFKQLMCYLLPDLFSPSLRLLSCSFSIKSSLWYLMFHSVLIRVTSACNTH